MLSRGVKKFLSGVLMAAALVAVGGICWLVVEFIGWQNDGPNYKKAESALRQTGLWGMGKAVGECLYLDTHFRDGDTMAIFAVNPSKRKALYDRISKTNGWREAEIPARDYAAWASAFREPYSLIQPMEEVTFDAMYYRDLYHERYPDQTDSFSPDRGWDELPVSMGLSEAPYTDDFDTAFYDRDTGLFVFYHECM